MVQAVVGANWGDEGKGKITDMLAEKADIIVRFQGGANAGHTIVNNYGKFASHTNPSANREGDTKKYPRQVLEFKRPHPPIFPTQKPVDLLEYLIKTYTNEGEIVLDNCMGSGSTGVACVNTNRDFIGIELDKDYFNIAKQRITGSQK
mgnify:CR=1 FL=1